VLFGKLSKFSARINETATNDQRESASAKSFVANWGKRLMNELIPVTRPFPLATPSHRPTPVQMPSTAARGQSVACNQQRFQFSHPVLYADALLLYDELNVFLIW
jgi:hypothetical protein